jgi:16S rRNA (guanine966-N2)-methyltransferase
MSQKSVSNVLRIIGGHWRSRRIRFEDAEGLRPTPDRVRETLFNWLQSDIIGASCLDAFAGSGALGFEALSRGASSVIMLEKNAKQHKMLKENIALLEADKAILIQGDTLSLLENPVAWQPKEGFDIVFMDPPFHQDFILPAIKHLLRHHLLKDNAFVYIETEQDFAALNIPTQFSLHRKTHAGLVNAFLLHYQKAENYIE